MCEFVCEARIARNDKRECGFLNCRRCSCRKIDLAQREMFKASTCFSCRRSSCCRQCETVVAPSRQQGPGHLVWDSRSGMDGSSRPRVMGPTTKFLRGLEKRQSRHWPSVGSAHVGTGTMGILCRHQAHLAGARQPSAHHRGSWQSRLGLPSYNSVDLLLRSLGVLVVSY